jgi:hypothetical protein
MAKTSQSVLTTLNTTGPLHSRPIRAAVGLAANYAANLVNLPELRESTRTLHELIVTLRAGLSRALLKNQGPMD